MDIITDMKYDLREIITLPRRKLRVSQKASDFLLNQWREYAKCVLRLLRLVSKARQTASYSVVSNITYFGIVGNSHLHPGLQFPN